MAEIFEYGKEEHQAGHEFLVTADLLASMGDSLVALGDPELALDFNQRAEILATSLFGEDHTLRRRLRLILEK